MRISVLNNRIVDLDTGRDVEGIINFSYNVSSGLLYVTFDTRRNEAPRGPEFRLSLGAEELAAMAAAPGNQPDQISQIAEAMNDVSESVAAGRWVDAVEQTRNLEAEYRRSMLDAFAGGDNPSGTVITPYRLPGDPARPPNRPPGPEQIEPSRWDLI